MCSLQLAHAGDVVNMSEEGIAGLFVNPHGCVHDMVTLRKVCLKTRCAEPGATQSSCPGSHFLNKWLSGLVIS